MNINEFHAKTSLLLDSMVAEWRFKHELDPDYISLDQRETRWLAEMISYMSKHFDVSESLLD